MHVVKELNKREAPRYIVGIGASAGGLEALEQFFKNAPIDPRLAYVVVQHLSPNFKSLMDELLARYTKLNIMRVDHDVEVVGETIYLIPPRKNMVLSEGKLLLTDQDLTGGVNLPINIFLHSLAEEKGEDAIGIILSGTGTDGTSGVKAVHEAGGLVVVQDPDSAGFNGMPKSAINTGSVDIIALPEEMPAKLIDYIQADGESAVETKKKDKMLLEENAFELILALLKRQFKIDFSEYKKETILRRIDRRIIFSEVENLQGYLEKLRESPSEIDHLFRDLLVEVTHFFRDQEAFKIIMEGVIPELIKNAAEEGVIRVWVPGCATGEEAYSVAILFHEYLLIHGSDVEVKIFATDVHPQSLDFASTGIFPKEKIDHIPLTYLNRYFKEENDRYRIAKELRQMIIFAPNNLIQDPPFTRIDLITCRNVLIYFRPSIQKKVLGNFHFALKKNGYLFLGPSENTGDLKDEFDVINRRWRIYRKQRDIRLPNIPDLRHSLATNAEFNYQDKVVLKQARPPKPNFNLKGYEWYDEVLNRFIPSGILIDKSYQAVHIFGDAGRYLTPSEGKVSFHILKMVTREISTALRALLHRASQEKKIVFYENIQFQAEGRENQQLTLTVEPFETRQKKSLYYMVQFEIQESAEHDNDLEKQRVNLSQESQEQLVILERELQYTKEHLQTTVEELETTNEELQSTNEELIASNEELQSTNEELHSVNEELYTVNSEYQQKINELMKLTNDMKNLQRSSRVLTLFLDRYLRIRDFTPEMAASFNLLPHDVGRPIQHLLYNLNLEQDELTTYARHVLDEGDSVTREVTIPGGNYYMMQILPYLTETGVAEGVVLNLTDITTLKHVQQDLNARELLYRQMVRKMDALVVRLDRQANLTFANEAFLQLHEANSADLMGEHITDFIQPKDHEQFESAWRALTPEECTYLIAVCLNSGPDKDSELYQLDGYTLYDDDNKFVEHQILAQPCQVKSNPAN